ncbi:DrmB family protein [Alkalihalobacillus sp. R86527]|uniref:DrmB family protein n=1 Tax=Alkalihalobacillus sp. R86527 TaxID=3093863 RepID=UPI00366FA6FF
MKEIPLRSSQLITTFGPGALVISPTGESALIGSLDKWFYDKYDNKAKEMNEYEIVEPRLRSALKVSKLFMPPDFRQGYQFRGDVLGNSQSNTDIYIPLLRFPSWQYCQYCKTLHQAQLSHRSSFLTCKGCNRKSKMIQVPFVIVCEHGHLSDFPWREWVHKDEDTRCEGLLKMVSTGGATLDSLKVKCSCNQERSLRGIMSRKNNIQQEESGVSELSKMLNASEKLYECPGSKPWYGSAEESEPCNAYPIAVLKNSINVYFPNKLSAIYLPGENKNAEEIINIFERNHITPSLLNMTGKETIEDKIKYVKRFCPAVIEDYSDKDIELAILYTEGEIEVESIEGTNPKNIEQHLRRKEFEVLISELDNKNLKVKKSWMKGDPSEHSISKFFNKVNKVTKLKETIALTGFNRLSSDSNSGGINQLLEGKKLLFKNPDKPENNWLPAYKVFGEGIFFTLDAEKLQEWERKSVVKKYFNRMLKNARNLEIDIGDSFETPKQVLLHTLSHLIINELALTCGYNAAALRERLYLDEDQSGILIYTSSGDIDGTFGGLVRMGREDVFFNIVTRALEKAGWCSSDPVCSEIGREAGQGVNNINGASCHSCSYLPETSCEAVNLFLDRTLLIDPRVGFFDMVRV